MTIYRPGQYLETLTNEQLIERLHATGYVQHTRFSEAISLQLQLISRPYIKLSDCDFAYGLDLRNDRILRDISFEGSRFAGDCSFDFFTTKIVSFTEIDAANATFSFERLAVAANENADVWLSLKPGTLPPKLETDDKVVREMFRRLQNATTFVSYQEAKAELE